MLTLLYFVLVGPSMMVGKFAEFFIWEVICNGDKRREKSSHPQVNQDKSVFIQRLLKEKVEEGRRADDLHDYYKRQAKQQQDNFQRELRELEDRYRRRNRRI